MTSRSPQQLLATAMRTNFVLFLIKVFSELHPGEPPLNLVWYLRAMCYFAVRCIDGELRRGVITVPPRHLKSITLSVALVAWQLGRDPTTKIMVANYSQDLSRTFAEQCRMVMESDWYKALYPNTRIDLNRNRVLHFYTTRGGFRKAISVEGSTTGFGADIIIIDDCMKADNVFSQIEREQVKRWYDGTLLTRLNNKGRGVIISIQQRLHEDDLPAYLLDKGFAHMNLPAIAVTAEAIALGNGEVHHRQVDELLNPDREDRAVLDQLRRELGPQVFSAQYQQDPTTPDGSIIQLHWFRKYQEPGRRDEYSKVVQSWDTATSADPSADWSVCTTWGYAHPDFDLLDVYRRRVEYPQLRRDMITLHDRWRPDKVLVEDANSGRGLVQDLRSHGYGKFICERPRGEKQQRVINITGELEAGNYFLPKEAPWLAALRSELRSFPYGKHDDQVDSLAQAINFMKRNWRWLEEERTPGGRLVRPIRARNRTELNKLMAERR